MEQIDVKRWTESNLPNPAAMIWHLGYEGFRVKHWVGQPGIVYAWRKNNDDHSHWVVSGELEVIHDNGESYRLKAGDRDFIPAQSWYMRRIIGEEPVSYLLGEKIKVEFIRK